MEEEKEPLTANDLTRVYIRAKKPDGRYASLHCGEASDEQFNAWAKSQMTVKGVPGPWPPEERAKFCNILWQNGTLHILSKEL